MSFDTFDLYSALLIGNSMSGELGKAEDELFCHVSEEELDTGWP
jgi:hypothetical protein